MKYLITRHFFIGFQLLSNGSFVAGVSDHPSANNLIVTLNDSSENNVGTNNYTFLDQKNTTSPNSWFQAMDSPEENQNSIQVVCLFFILH